MVRRRSYVALVLAAAVTVGVLVGLLIGRSTRPVRTVGEAIQKPAPAWDAVPTRTREAPTELAAHNLMLRKGPDFRVYVRWLRGRMARAQNNVTPSFDDPDSFYLDVDSGVLRANIGDIANFLNSGTSMKAPLGNIKLSGNEDRIRLTGTVHKVVPLPVELIATISATADNRIQVHVNKLNVLKIPFKGFLGLFHVDVADLFENPNLPGLEIKGNDLIFDTTKLLPPPHIRGRLTKVHVVNPDLEAVYGNGQEASERVEQWRNFLRLKQGSLDFGNLTMHPVDLIMIDISDDPWFDLDLTHYQNQLIHGYTRITPEAGLQIFMPDRRDIKPSSDPKDLSIEWFKNRGIKPPASVRRRQ